MKVRTPFCYIEVEYLFLIFSFICIFSEKIRIYFASFFVCYLFIVFHELAHILVGALVGKKLELFKLSLSGVNAKFERKKYKVKEDINYFSNILIYFAGPFANIILALIFHQNRFILQTNLSLALINLFPIYPLDGYNILENVLGDCKNVCIKTIENIASGVLFIIAIYQILYLKNITILMFCIYIFLLKNEQKKCLKIAKNK